MTNIRQLSEKDIFDNKGNFVLQEKEVWTPEMEAALQKEIDEGFEALYEAHISNVEE